MTQSVYSWMGTPLHLVLVDDFADAYNRALDAFLKAQHDYEARYGQKWTGREDIVIDWTDEEMSAFNGIGEIINTIVKVQGEGIDIPEDQVTSDYLVKL
jgi:hypothetical protein